MSAPSDLSDNDPPHDGDTFVPTSPENTETEEGAFIEYTTLADDSEIWRVDDWPALSNRFDLTEADLPDWHGALSGSETSWLVVRRIFGVAPLFGDSLTEDDMESWTPKSLGKKLGLPASSIQEHIATAARFWSKRREMDQSTARSAEISEDEIEEMSLFADIPEDKVNRILKSAGFERVKGNLLRLQVAERILHLQPYLKQINMRITARSVIRLEVSIAAQEDALVALTQDLEEERDKEKPSRTAIEAIEKRITATEKNLHNLAQQHSEALTDLGANDIDLNAKKTIFVDSISYMIERVRDYHQDPQNFLVDGVFTAAEVDWLLTPTKFREPQYRPDIVAHIADALVPEKLFDPEGQPWKPPRHICRDLHRIVKHLREAQVDPEDGAPGPDDEDTPATDVAGDLSAPTPHGAAGAPPLPAPPPPERSDTPLPAKTRTTNAPEKAGFIS